MVNLWLMMCIYNKRKIMVSCDCNKMRSLVNKKLILVLE